MNLTSWDYCQTREIVQQPSRMFYSPHWSTCIAINNVYVGNILVDTAANVCHQDLRFVTGHWLAQAQVRVWK